MQENQISVGDGLDLSPLDKKYEFQREIYRGGMSRIFLIRHKKLGNEWIVKFVDGQHAELANEAEVLKKLNHISLPQSIVDRETFKFELRSPMFPYSNTSAHNQKAGT